MNAAFSQCDIILLERGEPWGDVLRSALEERGAQVTSVSDAGEIATIFTKRKKAALVCADHSGCTDLIGEVCRQRNGEEPPGIIVVVCDPVSGRVQELMESGAFSCINHAHPAITAALCLADLERAFHLGGILEENRRLNAQLKRQNRSFGQIVRERTQRLMDAYTELKRMDKLKLDLIALISHQIRTPLCTILGQSELIRSGCSSDEADVNRMVESIHAQGLRLARFVDDATSFLGLRLGEHTHKEAVFPVAMAVSQAHEAVLGKAEEKGITLSVRVSSDLSVNSDPELVTEILRRVLDNALTYSPEGTTVCVDAEGADETVLLKIRDQGRGIEPKVLAHLFKPFELAHEVRHHSDGNGMSLAICREMINALGGHVEIHSEGLGQGCLVCIGLPAAVPESVAAQR